MSAPRSPRSSSAHSRAGPPMAVNYADVEPGTAIAPKSYRVTRLDLVKYAGASGDFNPIHWSERVARSVGLPGVIAHGMYTMALAGRALSTWAGRPDAVVEFGVRFTKPVAVPDDDIGAEVIIGGVVRRIGGPDQAGGIPAGHAQVDLTVTS